MARLHLELDQPTLARLIAVAAVEQRPLNWQAEIILRRGLELDYSTSRFGQDLGNPDNGTKTALGHEVGNDQPR